MVTDLRTFLARHELDDWIEQLLATEQRSLRLESLGRGRHVARLGCTPRLGADNAWPEADGGPLSFIAEIDLAAVAPVIGERILPGEGLLEFFYDADQEAWGFDPADRPKWRVLWVGDDATYRDFPASLPDLARYAPVALEGRLETILVDWESARIDDIGMDWAARRRYSEAISAWKTSLGPDPAIIHRLLGHPDPVQGDMMVECQLASNGIYVGRAHQPTEAETRVKPGARDWRLLLQIDSDDNSNMTWGDVGRIYYWIRDEDLRERNWDRVWLVLQCS